MLDRSATVRDVDWFRDLVEFQRLDLDPPYQRYSVWSLGYRQYFIDTILRNFPSPAIFLHKENLRDGGHMYHVVDGKQRLLSIFGFLQREFCLPRTHDEYPGQYYDDLPQPLRVSFGNYSIVVEIITTASLQDLRETFDRLNRNVRKLNKQELRHAQYDGEFMALMKHLADDPFWKSIGISTPARIRSMRDVEYVSEIYLLTMHGILDSSFRTIDKYYAKYDDEEAYQEAQNARAKYELCLSVVKKLDTTFLNSTRFVNLNDFYSLWAALLKLVDTGIYRHIDYEKTRQALRDFSDRVTVPEDIPEGDRVALAYSDAVRQGANKPTNRRARAEVIKGLILIE